MHQTPLRSLNPCCNGIWSQTALMRGVIQFKSLNPCYNGIWSQTLGVIGKFLEQCLNPCCNGIWSQTDCTASNNRWNSRS